MLLHQVMVVGEPRDLDRKSTRLNSSHDQISYAVFCLKKKTIRDSPTFPSPTRSLAESPIVQRVSPPTSRRARPPAHFIAPLPLAPVRPGLLVVCTATY